MRYQVELYHRKENYWSCPYCGRSRLIVWLLFSIFIIQIAFIMYCPEKLKLNRFKEVSLPKNRDYMTRLGYHEMPSSQFTGDNEVDFENRKTEVLDSAQRELAERKRLYEQDKKAVE